MQDVAMGTTADLTVFIMLGMKGMRTKLVNDDMGMQPHIEVIQFISGGGEARGPPKGGLYL